MAYNFTQQGETTYQIQSIGFKVQNQISWMIQGEPRE